MWAIARAQAVAGRLLGMVLTARTGARNSVTKSSSVADWRIDASFFGRVDDRAVLEASSQRSETPFSRSAEATGARTVLRAVSSTRSVSTALQAAG